MKRFLFICMLGLFLITGCTVDNSLQQEVDQLSIPETIKPGYFLPESENSEITFAWEVEPSHLLGEDGGFLAFETDNPVTVKLTASKGKKRLRKLLSQP
jgi:hypothetical protein